MILAIELRGVDYDCSIYYDLLSTCWVYLSNIVILPPKKRFTMIDFTFKELVAHDSINLNPMSPKVVLA